MGGFRKHGEIMVKSAEWVGLQFRDDCAMKSMSQLVCHFQAGRLQPISAEEFRANPGGSDPFSDVHKISIRVAWDPPGRRKVSKSPK
jgi:hypothetical protein